MLKRPRQAYRFARLGANLLSGSAFIKACYQFPSISKIDDYHLNDYRIFNAWVSDLSTSMNVALHVSGKMMDEEGLFVSNHISWLDTIILNNIRPLSFIARHDLEQWPLLGTFTKRMESVFINRQSKFHAYRSIPRIEEKLNAGRSVHLFPESTTSDGSALLPFYPMFYEAAARVGCRVQPVVIQYTDSEGKLLPEAAFINNDTFLNTLSRILWVDRVHAHVHFLEPLSPELLPRKTLCELSRKMINSYLVETKKNPP